MIQGLLEAGDQVAPHVGLTSLDQPGYERVMFHPVRASSPMTRSSRLAREGGCPPGRRRWPDSGRQVLRHGRGTAGEGPQRDGRKGTGKPPPANRTEAWSCWQPIIPVGSLRKSQS